MNLLQATPELQVDTEYFVKFSPEPYIILVAGFKASNAGFDFNHPNILAKQYSIFEFKHSRSNGSKFWTNCLGVDLYFAVPKEKIDVVVDKGYSNVPLMLNGERFILNVGGGTSGVIWTDVVHRIEHTNVNMNKKLLNAIASIAIAPVDFKEPFEVPPLFQNERASLAFLEHTAREKSNLAVGKSLAIKPNTRSPLTNETTFTITRMPGKYFRHFTVKDKANTFFKVFAKSIDWIETARINGALNIAA